MKVDSFKYLVREGFRNIWNNRIMSIASVCVMMACFVLTGAAFLFSENVKRILAGAESENTIRVCLNGDVNTIDAISIGQEIKKIPNITECTFVSKEETLKRELENMEANNFIEEEFSGAGNPYPHSYNISIGDISLYDETMEKVKEVKGVDTIEDIGQIVKKLMKMENIVKIVGVVLTLVLVVISLFILSNTVRITMYSRRREINIMKSVGATDWFIRFPFLVESVVIGIAAAALSSVALRFVCDKLIDALKNFMVVFTKVRFVSMSVSLFMVFVFCGILFGIIGALGSMRRYLKHDGGEIV